jgi:putative copper export protein/methionine-rich copper-binding protein CopC
VLAVAAALMLLIGPGARSVSAHAYLTTSSPSDGESLTSAPAELRLEFSEHVVLESTHIVVTDANGQSHPVTNLRAEDVTSASSTPDDQTQWQPGADEDAEEAAPSPEDEAAAEAAGVVDTEAPLAVIADVPDLPAGAYHVTWETLSSDDLHRTAGGFAFGVNTAVLADSRDGVVETPPDLVDAVGRWLVYGGLGLALGAALVGRLVGRLGDALGGDGSAGLRRAGTVGAAGAAVAGALWFALELARVGGSAVSGSYAARWGAREVALLLLALVIARGRRPVWTAALGVAASVATVLLGHTGLKGGPTWTAASALHLLASVTWFGAVVVLGWLVLRHRAHGLGHEHVREVLRGFFRPAAVLVAAVAVTGVYLAGDVVVSVDAVLTTVYGRVLLAKVLLVAAVGLLALVTSHRLHRRPDKTTPHPIDSAVFSIESAQFPVERAAFPIDSAEFPVERAEFPIDSAVFPIESARRRRILRGRPLPRRRIVLEATGLGLAVALAAVLTSGQPAISPSLVDGPAAAPSPILDHSAEGLQETVVISPNRPGDSVLTLDIFDARRPSPGPVTGVSVTLPARTGAASSAPVVAHRLSDHRWAAGIRLRETGTTPVTVTVRRQGMAPTVTTFDWVVGRGSAAPTAVVSRAPISDALQRVALGLLVAILLVGALVWRVGSRRRRRSSTAPPPAPRPDDGPGGPQKHHRARVGTP